MEGSSEEADSIQKKRIAIEVLVDSEDIQIELQGDAIIGEVVFVTGLGLAMEATLVRLLEHVLVSGDEKLLGTSRAAFLVPAETPSRRASVLSGVGSQHGIFGSEFIE